MKKPPQRLVPVSVPDSIVVVVRKNHAAASVIPAFFVVGFLVVAAWWTSQGNPKPLVTVTDPATDAVYPASAKKVSGLGPRPAQTGPSQDAFGGVPHQGAPFARPAATFFDVAPDPAPETAPKVPDSNNPFGTQTAD